MMGTIVSLPQAVRDNAGLVSVPMAVKPGCRGASCPAFATCQGRCETRRVKLGDGYPGGSVQRRD
jgi:hypothetical protein